MNLIQWIILLFAVVAEVGAIAGLRRGRVSPAGLVFWSLVWILVGVVAVWPDTTYLVADLVGITRGADLVLYLGLLLAFFILFRNAVRMEKIERNLATLVRELALRDPQLPSTGKQGEITPPADRGADSAN